MNHDNVASLLTETEESTNIEEEHVVLKKQKVDNNTTTTTEKSDKEDTIKEKNSNKNKQKNSAIYGNYHDYYSIRNESNVEQDHRLKYLTKDIFHQKRCLDIGCNSGDLVFKISKDYNPTQIIGVDIDKYLINKAYHRLTLEASKLNNSTTPTTTPTTAPTSHTITTAIIDSSNLKIDKKDFIPISFRMISDGIISNEFPHNISFYCQNFLYSSKIVDKPNSFDVITALSISKWIHLNWGDEGIKKFLKKIYNLLKDGGIFLFEPQPFRGYSKRKNLTELIKKNYKEIVFKPDQFVSFLIETVGFESFEFLNESEAKSKGFDRPLYKFIKPSSSSKKSNLETTTTTTTTLESK